MDNLTTALNTLPVMVVNLAYAVVVVGLASLALYAYSIKRRLHADY